MGGEGGGVELVFILLFLARRLGILPESILELHLVHCFPVQEDQEQRQSCAGKEKMAKMVWSRLSRPRDSHCYLCFVNIDYVTAEITYILCL